ncbi:hypothetical protein Despr_2433 [Desulfobulbus propionicus DSM 2032]|uniref:Phage tail protein n=1 Tax=Desulfobulbus propionicus (strain ATCC 33891 / DSM 2032 / VKM B-1956 / 1pr3) TaxID=577650 RepID=A0A7U3YND4_DESPD|nr:hypothetical protein [Desulfobulbus propionicus]ADW18572.1 hypothetical protein Despr_2433 [Desulfobulbus propionicus DSM 2032]
MLATIGNAIQARLEGLDAFKAVERGFSKRALQSPPSAVFFLYDDEQVTDSPYAMRRLTWEIALLVSYLDPVKGQALMDDLVDQVRPALTDWRPAAQGCLPSTVTRIRYEGVEEALLIYTVRVTMQVVPEKIL